MCGTDFVADTAQVLNVASVFVKLQSCVGMHRVDDVVIVNVLTVDMRGDHHLVALPRTLSKFHPDAICFLGHDFLVGVEGLHVMSKADTVGLVPRCLGGHELSVGKFGRAVLPRDSVDLLFNLRLVRLQAIVDDRSHHRGQAVLAVLVLDFHDDCHSPSLPFDRARR